MRLVGIVVAFDVLESRFVFVIDDSSGQTIDVTCDRPKSVQPRSIEPNYAAYDIQSIMAEVPRKGVTPSRKEVDLSGIEVGTIVKIKGHVSIWWGTKQIKLERFWLIESTNEEMNAWGETNQFLSNVLFKPWVLGEKEVLRAEKKSRLGPARRERRKATRRLQDASNMAKATVDRERPVANNEKEPANSELIAERAFSRQRERQDREKALQARNRSLREENVETGKELLQQEARVHSTRTSTSNALTSARNVDYRKLDEGAQKEKERQFEREERERILQQKSQHSRQVNMPTQHETDIDARPFQHYAGAKGGTGIIAQRPSSGESTRPEKEQAMQRRAAERALREQQYQQRLFREQNPDPRLQEHSGGARIS